MNAIDIMISEHTNVKRILKVARALCANILEKDEVLYDDFESLIYIIRNYADTHHHQKEEQILFDIMIKNLGELAEKVVRHGMMVEHDYGRLYVKNLEIALNEVKSGNNEYKLDIIANAVSYTNLLERHIDKEDRVVFTFANRELSKELLQQIDRDCMIYEEKHSETRDKCINILEDLENKLQISK